MSALHNASCEDCQYYRPQASFVDAYKDFDRNPPREPLMKSLLELRKDETHVQENEMELQLELLMTEQKVWPKRPRFAPVCVFTGELLIPAAKNADHQCPDYKPALNRQGCACRTCRFLVRPETRIGERHRMPTGAGGSQEAAFYRQINKEQDDADAMAQALEIDQSFYSDGCLPAAYFLPTCAVRVTDGRINVAPFCNLRNDCEEHSPHITLPKALVDFVRQTASQVDKVAVDHTIKIAQLVAKWGNAQPAECMADLAAWVKEDPANRWDVASWTFSYLYGRWTADAEKKCHAAKLPSRGPSDALPPQWGAAPEVGPASLSPFIAGCDAYEWGILAAYSRSSKQNSTFAAGVICQQLAEFLVTVVSPFEAAACIDAASALIAYENLFASDTLDLVDGFVQRLKGYAERVRLIAQTDLQQHFEEFAGNLSYKMGRWLALASRAPSSLARLDAIDERLGKIARQQDKSKIAEARAEGTELLEKVGMLAVGQLPASDRIELLNRLIISNDSALERDKTDEADLETEAFNAVAEKSGLATVLDQPIDKDYPVYTYRMVIRNTIRQAWGLVFDVPLATENPRRRVLTTLLLLRGLEPFTKTALEVYDHHPQPGRLPESQEQALSDPTATTLEAFHGAQFGLPDIAKDYLTAGRRIGAPYLLATTAH